MLPAQYVAPYRRRGKSDRIDTDALLEAHRCDGITEVPVRSVDQQQIQQLHCIREQWKKTRVQRINGLRGCLRELGFAIPLGVSSVHKHAIAILEDDGIPPALKSAFAGLLDEINRLEESMKQCERDLKLLTKNNDAVQRLQEVPAIGLMTSTAMVTSIGTPHRFSNGRKLASWLGLTPREHSSGNSRSLGRITKQGNGYIRCLLTHGARSVLVRAKINLKSWHTIKQAPTMGLNTLRARWSQQSHLCDSE
jgi:transposase